jgi:hypothetical protein
LAKHVAYMACNTLVESHKVKRSHGKEQDQIKSGIKYVVITLTAFDWLIVGSNGELTSTWN